MARALDVAAYILSKRGPMTAMKLQKLVYYSQAWNLVWDERRLFPEAIEAWANGPVVRELYSKHRGMWEVTDPAAFGDPAALNAQERGTVDAVLQAYGDKPAHWLSELTHNEPPWRLARERAGLKDRERGSAEIELSDMHEYYDSLTSEAAEAL